MSGKEKLLSLVVLIATALSGGFLFSNSSYKAKWELKKAQIPVETASLAQAARDGRLVHVRLLVRAGVDPNLGMEDAIPPIVWALEGNHMDVARFLAEQKINPSIIGSDGRAPLAAAAARGDLALVQRLVLLGANPYHVDQNGETAADISQANGYPEVTKYLRSVSSGETQTN